jgi:hypothetical protein
MRLKDMSFNDKLREVTERFTQEVESLKITVAVLKSEKDKEEARHEAEFHATVDHNSGTLHEKENDHNRTLMAEFEKFQELQQKLADTQVLWQERAKDKEEYHKSALAECNEENEAKIRMKNAEVQRVRCGMCYSLILAAGRRDAAAGTRIPRNATSNRRRH